MEFLPHTWHECYNRKGIASIIVQTNETVIGQPGLMQVVNYYWDKQDVLNVDWEKKKKTFPSEVVAIFYIKTKKCI